MLAQLGADEQQVHDCISQAVREKDVASFLVGFLSTPGGPQGSTRPILNHDLLKYKGHCISSELIPKWERMRHPFRCETCRS